MLNEAVDAAQRNVLTSSKLVGSLIDKLRKGGCGEQMVGFQLRHDTFGHPVKETPKK